MDDTGPLPTQLIRRGYLWVAVAGFAVAVVCAMAVRDGTLSDPERALFLQINGLPDWLEPPFWLVQLAGSLAFVLGVAMATAVLRRWRLAVGIVLVVPIKLALEWLVFKSLVARSRPSFTVAEAIVREYNSSQLGFPSGHAVLVFALATMIAPYVGRRTRWVLFSLAVTACVARVYLAAHNPLDVVAGAGLGAGLGSVWNLVAGVHPGGSSSVARGPHR